MAAIEKRGAAWRARVRLGGETVTRTFDTQAEASDWADAEEARIRVGGPRPNDPVDVSAMTVAALFERYGREVSPDKGGHRYEVNALRKLGAHLPGLAVDVDGPTLARWRDKRLLSVSGSSVNRELALISSVFNRAIKEWGLKLAVNPVTQIMRPKNNPSRTRRVTPAERATVLRFLAWDGICAPQDKRQWIAWAFSLALETMMRTGEVLHMDWQNVRLDKRYIHLPKTKNGYRRNVPLSSGALALFALLPEAGREGVVVPVHAGTFGVYFREALRDAEIPDLHFHDTRRESLTTLSKKLSILELAKSSGHRDIRHLMIYYEPDPTELADKLG